MKCEIEKTKLHLFYDNQLDEDEVKFLSQHIKECKFCGKELAYLSQFKKQFSEMEYVKIGSSLLLQLNQIGKITKSSFFELLKDIYKITFKNKKSIFHIDTIFETTLHKKYSEIIIRWVFYC